MSYGRSAREALRYTYIETDDEFRARMLIKVAPWRPYSLLQLREEKLDEYVWENWKAQRKLLVSE